MSIIINNKALRSLKASSFDENALQDYILCIKVASESVSFCAFQQYTNECQFFESYNLGGYNHDVLPLKELQQIVESHSLLSSHEWKKVFVIISDRKCTLVPTPLHQSKTVEYFRLNCDFDPATENITEFEYKNLQITAVFSISKALKEWIQKQYQPTPIEYIHSNLGFLKGVTSLASVATTNSIFTLIEPGRVTFIELANNKLKLLNSFTSTSPEDTLYYSLFVMNELGIVPKRAELNCWGDIEENDATYNLLSKYVKEISLGKRPMDLIFANEFNEIPESIDFDLFCAYNLLNK